MSDSKTINPLPSRWIVLKNGGKHCCPCCRSLLAILDQRDTHATSAHLKLEQGYYRCEDGVYRLRKARIWRTAEERKKVAALQRYRAEGNARAQDEQLCAEVETIIRRTYQHENERGEYANYQTIIRDGDLPRTILCFQCKKLVIIESLRGD